MSLWTKLRDTAEAIFVPFAESDSARKETGGITGALNKGYSAIGGGVNKVLGRPSSDEKRNQQYAINDQVKAYKAQTELSEKQLATTQAEKNVAKRQIQEKQIRALRNNYRPAGGFAGASSAGLGTNNTQPNKLGTA